MSNHRRSSFAAGGVRLTRRQALTTTFGCLLSAAGSRALAQSPEPEEAGLSVRFKLVREISPVEHDLVRGVAIHPDGSLLATFGNVLRDEPDETGSRFDHCYVRVLATDSGTLISEITSSTKGSESIRPEQLTFSPDGRVLAFNDLNRDDLWLVNLSDGKKPRRLDTPFAGVTRVVFSADGAEVGQAGFLKGGLAFQVWEVATGKKQRVWELPKAHGQFAVSPNGELLAFTPSYLGRSAEQPVTLWEWRTGRPLGALEGKSGCLAFHPRQPILAVGGQQTTLYDVASRKPIRTLNVEAQSLSFSRDGKMLLIAARDLNLVDVQSGQVSRSVVRWSRQSEDWRAQQVQFSRDGRYVLAEGFQRTEVRSSSHHVRVWRMEAA